METENETLRSRIVHAFRDVPFPYKDDEVTDEERRNFQLLSAMFHDKEGEEPPIIPVSELEALWTSLSEIYLDLDNFSPEECRYVLPRILTLLIPYHEELPEMTGNVLSLLNLSGRFAPRKQKAIDKSVLAGNGYPERIAAFHRGCFMLFTQPQNAAVLAWLIAAREWGDDWFYYEQEDVEVAIPYWQSAATEETNHISWPERANDVHSDEIAMILQRLLPGGAE